MRQGPCTGEAEHLQLLETIYRCARLFHGDPDGEVADTLARWLGADASTNLFELLIRAALPRVPRSVTKIWVGALSYAAEFGVRPDKLHDFIWIKGGLVKCGQTDPSERREEVARWKRDREQRRG